MEERVSTLKKTESATGIQKPNKIPRQAGILTEETTTPGRSIKVLKGRKRDAAKAKNTTQRNCDNALAGYVSVMTGMLQRLHF